MPGNESVGRDGALRMHTKLQRGALRVEVSGTADYETTAAYWRAIDAELVKDRVLRVLLIDRTTGDALTADDWKRLVASVAGTAVARARIAHVKPNGLQNIEYCALYALEAGIDARVFTHETEADLWLRYGEKS